MMCILVVDGYKQQFLFTLLHFHPDDNWKIQSKWQQSVFSELKLITEQVMAALILQSVTLVNGRNIY